MPLCIVFLIADVCSGVCYFLAGKEISTRTWDAAVSSNLLVVIGGGGQGYWWLKAGVQLITQDIDAFSGLQVARSEFWVDSFSLAAAALKTLIPAATDLSKYPANNCSARESRPFSNSPSPTVRFLLEQLSFLWPNANVHAVFMSQMCWPRTHWNVSHGCEQLWDRTLGEGIRSFGFSLVSGNSVLLQGFIIQTSLSCKQRKSYLIITQS